MEQKVKIFVDDRENKNLIEELIKLGAEVKVLRLNVADFICSPRVGVEYKKVSDFLNSLTDGRLLYQAKMLKKSFERPVMVIEGNEDIFSLRNIHPNAIRGVLCSIIVDYCIPVINSKNLKETAALIFALAKKEQISISNGFSLHKKKPIKIKNIQEYIISSLPGIGSATAKRLLQRFGSVAAVINAPERELMEVEKIGKKKSREIKRVVEEQYEK